MVNLDKIVSLAKRRGFVYPGSEIYGGLSGFFDWGPLGNNLVLNLKQRWWRDVVQMNDNIVGISAAIIMNAKFWKASGHANNFSDTLVECKKCHHRFKIEEVKNNKCLDCNGELTPPKQFNLMFKINVGSSEDTTSLAYLRPETAGGIFINFKNVLNTTRLKIPFGIAQIGKAFRNEINPRDFIFRTREFEQMELEYFVKPNEDKKYFKEWVERRLAWYKNIGLKNIRLREQTKKERAHYSKATIDIEYEFPFGWQEIEGIANRGDFDLRMHNLTYFDETEKKFYRPHIIEPSAGVERIILAIFCEAYHEEKDRLVLKLHPQLAPIKAAVFPLLANKPQLVKLAKKVYEDLKSEFTISWDDRGNIGKRYFSQDEIGTPFCLTIDFKSLTNNDLTVRYRDSMKQIRVKIKKLKDWLSKNLAA